MAAVLDRGLQGPPALRARTSALVRRGPPPHPAPPSSPSETKSEDGGTGATDGHAESTRPRDAAGRSPAPADPAAAPALARPQGTWCLAREPPGFPSATFSRLRGSVRDSRHLHLPLSRGLSPCAPGKAEEVGWRGAAGVWGRRQGAAGAEQGGRAPVPQTTPKSRLGPRLLCDGPPMRVGELPVHRPPNGRGPEGLLGRDTGLGPPGHAVSPDPDTRHRLGARGLPASPSRVMLR